MSNDEKITVDITNRPSDKSRHSRQEWQAHIGLREAVETKRDIREARDRLGQFTVRFVTEAICGDEKAAQIFGEHGGQELVRDMKIDLRTLKSLADNTGGKKTAEVVSRTVLREIQEPKKEVSDQQVELLRALLKTMDPDIIKRALETK